MPRVSSTVPRTPGRLIRVSLGGVVASLIGIVGLPVGTASAQQVVAAPPICACTAERRQIATLEEARRACETQRSSCDSQRASCVSRGERTSNELSSVRRELDESHNTGVAAQSARDQICVATGEIVTDVLQSRSELPDTANCVSPANRRALGELVVSWRNSRTTLQRLESYARGDIDSIPPAGMPQRGEIEALTSRLAGSARDAPLVYRRLLLEAVRSLAPRFWQNLRSSGRDAVDAWFASSADLDAAFTAEAQDELAARTSGSAAGPSQSKALRFVRSYLDLVGCDEEGHPSLRQCDRAAQLQAFIESSTALIARERVNEIWESECETVVPDTVLSWVREFPSQQLSLGTAEWAGVTAAGYDKLVACYLADTAARESHFPDWLARHLPRPSALTHRTLTHLDQLRGRWDAASPEAMCLTAVHTLRNLPTPADCSLPEPARRRLLSWFERRRTIQRGDEGVSLHSCGSYVDAFWRGHDVRVLVSFPGVPSPEELVHAEHEGGPASTIALRAHCDDRLGAVATFPRRLHDVAAVAIAAGEDIAGSPWRMDSTGAAPLEADGFETALRFASWARHSVTGVNACSVLRLTAADCAACGPANSATRYDCSLVAAIDERWRLWMRVFGGSLLGLLIAIVTTRWGVSMTRSLRSVGAWRKEIVGHLRRLGLKVHSDPLRVVFPSRMSVIRLTLPGGPWERWGRTMAILHAEKSTQITERDVRSAALAARAEDGELAIVTHDEGASPNLPAVRAMLDWAARGPRAAVQILAVSSGRVRWASSTDDLLDLVEQVSLRGNPFEVRGRLVSSSQFFNRERLVSGLLASAQAGSWTVVTGLRRFGKSSLALEVARRLQAPHAYVDLAGFHHEIASGVNPTKSVDAILRYVCRQLHASAAGIYGREVPLPDPPAETTSMDIDTLTSWIRSFLEACRAANGGRALSPLVIFDEVEQAIGVGADRVSSAIDVLSILVGRLRACLTDALATQGGDRVGVLFCSAIHAVLWAPLTTLGRQSLLGAFPSVSVPRLPEDAAFAMMRGLGARQGIRFTEQALAMIVREAQGIPILVRRIGSSVLELYDPERARQGSLGAVEIGIEGASAAVRREEEDGAPLRVWVESEIGDLHSPVGGLLRIIARRGTVPVDELKARAVEATAAQFEELGLARILGPEETRRRAQEAAGFLVRMLDEIGILVPEGDVTRPHAFTFPDSIVRRILASESSASLLGF